MPMVDARPEKCNRENGEKREAGRHPKRFDFSRQGGNQTETFGLATLFKGVCIDFYAKELEISFFELAKADFLEGRGKYGGIAIPNSEMRACVRVCPIRSGCSAIFGFGLFVVEIAGFKPQTYLLWIL